MCVTGTRRVVIATRKLLYDTDGLLDAKLDVLVISWYYSLLHDKNTCARACSDGLVRQVLEALTKEYMGTAITLQLMSYAEKMASLSSGERG